MEEKKEREREESGHEFLEILRVSLSNGLFTPDKGYLHGTCTSRKKQWREEEDHSPSGHPEAGCRLMTFL
jgi:hypothetical protein